jgi:hypothetical protein
MNPKPTRELRGRVAPSHLLKQVVTIKTFFRIFLKSLVLQVSALQGGLGGFLKRLQPAEWRKILIIAMLVVQYL